MTDYNEIERALSYVSNSDDRELWVRMGAGIKTELGEDGFDIWDRWSQTADNYQSQSAKAVWKSLKPGRVNIGSVFHEAKQGGYKPDKTQFRPVVDPEELKRKAQERQQREAQAIAERLEAADQAKDKAQALFNKGDPVNPNHPYLLSKGITDQAILANLRQQGNNLLVPVKQNKEIVAVQKINPDGGKYFGKDEMLTGSAFLIGDASHAKATGLILTEGLATGASLHAATGKPVLVVFAAHNLVAVAENIKSADFPVVLAADNDSKTKNAGLKFAQKAAEILGSRAEIKMPIFDDKDTAIYQDKHGAGKFPSDFNDLHEIRGLEAVRQVIGETPVLKKNEMENEKESTMKLQEPESFKDLPEPDQEQNEPVERGSVQVENYIEVDLEQIKAQTVSSNKKIEDDVQVKNTDNPNTTKKESVQEQLNPSSGLNNEQSIEQPRPITDLEYKAPPESLKNKYLYADGRYLDNNGRTTVFVDSGKQLKTSKSDLQTVHDMVEVAKDKGWSHIKLFGNREFKRQAFLEAESQGIKTTGYQPTPEDLAALKHLQDERALNKIESVPVSEKEIETQGKSVKQSVEKQDLNAGILVKHGAAPYMHDEKNKMNYFVTLKQGEKEHTVWGLGLEDALNKSNAKVGDELSLKNIGRRAVEVDTPIFDKDGKTVIDHEKIVTHRNEWEATIFNKKEVEPEKPELTTNNQADRQNDKALQAQAATEADKLKAQNQVPTAAQIESSPKADIDADVRMADIGGQSVNSEVKIMADRMAQSGGVKGLDKANIAKFQAYKSMAKEVVANMKADHRQDAMRNFDNNMDKAINGTTLNMPEPLQANVQKQQQREKEQTKQNEMELER